MSRTIEIGVKALVVRRLFEFVKPLVAAKSGPLAVEPRLEQIDADLHEMWRSDLQEHQAQDLRCLSRVLGPKFKKTRVLRISAKGLEPCLRACAAVRLRLRSTELAPIDDLELETGELETKLTSERMVGAYQTYVVLAALQEILIRHLDPSAEE